MYPKRIQPQPLYEIMFSFCFFFFITLSSKKERGMVGKLSILFKGYTSPLPGLYICLLRSNVPHADLVAFVDSCAELTLAVCCALLFCDNTMGATNAFYFHIICTLISKKGAQSFRPEGTE